MGEPRSVVITGASRGLGLASAAHLYKRGWHIVAAMRTPQVGLQNILDATGASADSSRLIGVQLDLTDQRRSRPQPRPSSRRSGPLMPWCTTPGTAVGCVEELDLDVWQQLFATNLFGPVALTNALLPSMRAAGRGRIVVIASENGVRGMPSTAPYSASKAGSAVGRSPGCRDRAVRARCQRPGDRGV